MASLAVDTAVERLSDEHFTATLSKDWEIWGPNGGYVAAIALRAAQAVSEGMLPASFFCQYLSVAQFDRVDIRVNCVKSGRNARAFDVTIQQGDKTVLKALIWLSKTVNGLEHNFIERPRTWIPFEQMPNENTQWPFPFWRNFSVRRIQPDDVDAERRAGKAVAPNWYKFKPDIPLDDPFVNAARSVILIDTMQWPAATLAYDEGSLQHVAPSLDLYVQFHNSHSPHHWLFSEAKSDVAERGLIGGSARVWDQAGKLLASGGSQLLCLPTKAH